MKWARRCLLVLAPALAFACFPEPPPDLAGLPPTRPTILHASVVPNPSVTLAEWNEFIVPVELADPTQTFVWVAFIDYNPYTGAGRVLLPQESKFVPANQTGNVRTLGISLPEPSPDRCHLVEVIVAQALVDDGTARRPIDPPGGDIVSWRYNPGGSPQGCPSLDAGIEAAAASVP